MWVKIHNAECYEASADGEIRNAKTGRLLKQYVGKDGYMRTQLHRKTMLVHRIIADTFTLKPVGKNFVNHIDGNKQNNRYTNLEWVTRSENMEHAYRLGLKPHPVGERNGRSRLTEDDVRFIRANYIPGSATLGAKALSKRFGVAPQTISAAVRGQNWTGVE